MPKSQTPKIMIIVSDMRAEDAAFVKRLESVSDLSSWTKEDYLAEIDRADSISLVIKEDYIIYGFLIARLIINNRLQLYDKYDKSDSIYDKSESETEAEIYNIAIDPLRRGRNFGSKLIDKLINKTISSNLRKIHLEVRSSNSTAIAFYRKNKFIEVGRRRNFYSRPPEDAILMCRNI